MSINQSIKCSVHNCKYHDGSEQYCTLNEIQIGTHEASPKMDQCTDCESFEINN
ncbi:DUF1540 domain-containing protein [Clostridium sp. BJN0001]|uniref:DUF1540 domain-containing protein n=1 Tax=Clostridium sp. BJN0001 TaxID=2930219 RepID=UPI001FD37143|nr:DUF1540 domain-containing protein [Clostridium sp. BJN0001]